LLVLQFIQFVAIIFESKHSLLFSLDSPDARTNTNQRHAAVTDGYDNLPVATLVSEDTMPPSTAPLTPSAGGGDRFAVVDNDPTVALSRFPMMMQRCPNCSRESRTRVTTAPSWKTWAASGCLFFAFWPLCWLPLVVDSCKTTEHFCVSCGAKVAKVEAFDDCCVEHRG